MCYEQILQLTKKQHENAINFFIIASVLKNELKFCKTFKHICIRTFQSAVLLNLLNATANATNYSTQNS